MSDPSLAATPRRRALLAVGFALLLLPLAGLGAADGYRGSSDLHSAIEVIGGLIGLVAGLTLISRAIAFDDRMHLLFGVGFFANASADIVHGLLPFLAARGLSALPASALDRFVPGSYLAGRLMLALLLLAAPALAPRLREVRRTEALVIGVSVVSLGALTTVMLFLARLPQLQFPGRTVSRPADLVVAVLFVAAGSVLWRVFLADREPMTGWVLVAAGVAALGQFTMGTSGSLFDAPFDLAHLYKVVTYLLPLVGVSLYQVQLQVSLSEANLQLRDLDAAKTDFLSVISHELKTPLTAVVGFSSLLEEYWDSIPVEQKLEHVEAIRRQGLRLQRLIDDLLLLTSLEADEVHPRRRSVALAGFVAGLVESRELDVQAIDVPAQLTAEVDPLHLGTMLGHYVENAAKYGRAPIVIRGWDDEGAAVLVVDDAGDGVPAGFRPRLFRDRFAQAERGETRASTGTGLGLSIVGGLVQRNGGEPFYEASPDGGARFGLRLPRPSVAAVAEDGIPVVT